MRCSHGEVALFVLSLFLPELADARTNTYLLAFLLQNTHLPISYKMLGPPWKRLQMSGEFVFHSFSLSALFSVRLSCRARCCKL